MAKVKPSAQVVGFAVGSLRSQSQLTSGRASEGPWVDDLWLAPFTTYCNLYHVRRFVKGCGVMEIAQFYAHVIAMLRGRLLTRSIWVGVCGVPRHKKRARSTVKSRFFALLRMTGARDATTWRTTQANRDPSPFSLPPSSPGPLCVPFPRPGPGYRPLQRGSAQAAHGACGPARVSR